MLKQREGKKKLIWIQILLWGFGVISIGYYFVILLIMGFRKDFSLVWIAGGLISVGIARLIHRLGEHSFTRADKLTNVLMAVFFAGLIVFLFIEGIIIKTGFTKPSPDADYLVVLGAQINGTRVSSALRYRLDAAFDYAMDNPETKVIVSGGKGYREDISEAEAMLRYLVGKGLNQNRIIMENKSTSTNENIMYSRQLLENAEYVVIVTNHFHLYRGMKIAKKQLAQRVGGLGADTRTPLFLNYYVREVFAVIKDYLIRNI